MKRFILSAFCAVLSFPGTSAFAQQPPPAASKPIVVSSGRVNLVRARIKELTARLHHQQKLGKVNQKRGAALSGILKSLESQLNTDIKHNGKKELTDEQFRILSKSLGNIARSLADTKPGKPMKHAVPLKHPAKTPPTLPSPTPVDASASEDLESGK